MKKLGKLLHTRLVPQLALFAAFSFVVMMFNIPLPGGTTGHAAGIALAAIVLGPWGAVVAISVALGIQAIFFGDGGILALGANCFNMAVAGSFTASAVYRAVAGNSPLQSRRRVVAGTLAGYSALNVAALLTAIQFGVQPELFRDVAGKPLYAPYPLHIAVPAMMLPHLLVAGVAEAVFTGGVLAWMQKLDPELLSRTAPGAGEAKTPRLRPLWAGLVLLMLLTPLGLLASGTAWGEWAPEDFANSQARQEIQSGSLGHPAPATAPRGMKETAEVWRAPVPDYSPSFLGNEKAGYIFSALAGGLLIWAACFLVGSLVRRPAN